MTTMQMVGAASGWEDVNWHNIDWAKAHQTVKRLQTRIAKAVREGRWGKVKALQWLLTHSFYGRAIAVKRVTENQGKKTPGVDRETWDTPESKAKAVMSLKRRGYRPRPLRRVFIPKANGKKRPLGIPAMKDRAMQALYLLALEPVAETQADPNSYGFRPMRASRDAAEQCFIALAKRDSAQWVLDADISGCFDNISHDWLITNIPMDKVILQKWLKSGFVWQNQWFPTEAGTPQGGIISPTLCVRIVVVSIDPETRGRQRKNEVARYGQSFKDRAVARLLPPESVAVQTLARELSISAATLARWRAEALSQPVGERGWSAGARFEAVLSTAAMDEASKGAWCREHGVYPQTLEQWRTAALQALDESEEVARQALREKKAERGRIKELERDLRRKEKALAEAAALLVLSKKLEAIFPKDEDA